MPEEAIYAESGTLGPERSKTTAPLLQRGSTVFFGSVICLTLFAAVLLRCSGLNAQSLWADEGYTTWFSQFSPAEQWHLLPWETQAPIYHIVLHYWTGLWGDSVTSFRALSACFSVLSLGVFFLIARKLWPNRTFVALGLMLYAFSYFQIWYAKEARSYASLSFLLLTSVYCMLLCLDKPGWLRYGGVILTLSATLYMHNMALYYLPGAVAMWFVYPSSMRSRERLKSFAIIGAGVVLLYIPWIPMLVKQAVSVHGYFWAPKPTATDLLSTICTFSGIDVYVLTGLRSHLPGRLFGLRTWMLLTVLILVICMVGTWIGVRAEDRRKSIALQAYTLFPILLVFAWSQFSTSVYVDRNFIGACALFPMILCAPIAVQSGRKKTFYRIIASTLLLGAVTSLAFHQQRKDDWRGLTEYLLKIPERQRLVVVFQPYCQILVHYYSTGLFRSYPQPEITGMIKQFNVAPRGPGILPDLRTADPIGTLSQALASRKYREIDVALQLERLPEKVQLIPDYFKEHCSAVENVQFNNLGVSRCILRSN